MKVTQSEIKKNLQGINRGVDEAENQINNLEHKEEKSIQPQQHKGKRIQKNKDRLRSFWDNFKCTNILIIRVLEGEEKEQEIENFLKNIMKKKLPEFGRGNRHTSPGSKESLKQDGHKEDHTETRRNENATG